MWGDILIKGKLSRIHNFIVLGMLINPFCFSIFLERASNYQISYRKIKQDKKFRESSFLLNARYDRRNGRRSLFLSASQLVVRWVRHWGNKVNEEKVGDTGNGIAVGSHGFVYTVGFTYAIPRPEHDDTVPIPMDRDFLLVKWSANGTLIWNRTWGKTRPAKNNLNDVGYDVAVANQAVYTVGSTGSFEGRNQTIVVMKWSKKGDLLWKKTWRGEHEDIIGMGIAASENAIYTTALGFPGTVMKWSPQGELRWVQTCPNHWVYEVTISEKYIYTVSEGKNTNETLGLTKWGKNGTKYWHRTVKNGTGYDLCLAQHAIYTTGATANEDDVLVVKWSLSGSIRWQRQWTQNHVQGRGIVATAKGIYVITNNGKLLHWNQKGHYITYKEHSGGGEGIVAVQNDTFYTVGTSPHNDLLLIRWQIEPTSFPTQFLLYSLLIVTSAIILISLIYYIQNEEA